MLPSMAVSESGTGQHRQAAHLGQKQWSGTSGGFFYTPHPCRYLDGVKVRASQKKKTVPRAAQRLQGTGVPVQQKRIKAEQMQP